MFFYRRRISTESRQILSHTKPGSFVPVSSIQLALTECRRESKFQEARQFFHILLDQIQNHFNESVQYEFEVAANLYFYQLLETKQSVRLFAQDFRLYSKTMETFGKAFTVSSQNSSTQNPLTVRLEFAMKLAEYNTQYASICALNLIESLPWRALHRLNAQFLKREALLKNYYVLKNLPEIFLLTQFKVPERIPEFNSKYLEFLLSAFQAYVDLPATPPDTAIFCKELTNLFTKIETKADDNMIKEIAMEPKQIMSLFLNVFKKAVHVLSEEDGIALHEALERHLEFWRKHTEHLPLPVYRKAIPLLCIQETRLLALKEVLSAHHGKLFIYSPTEFTHDYRQNAMDPKKMVSYLWNAINEIERVRLESPEFWNKMIQNGSASEWIDLKMSFLCYLCRMNPEQNSMVHVLNILHREITSGYIPQSSTWGAIFYGLAYWSPKTIKKESQYEGSDLTVFTQEIMSPAQNGQWCKDILNGKDAQKRKEKVLNTLEMMKNQNMPLDETVYGPVFFALRFTGMTSSFYDQFDCSHTPYTVFSMIRGLLDVGSLEDAVVLFKSVDEWNPDHYRAFAYALCLKPEGLDYFMKEFYFVMKRKDYSLDRPLIMEILKASLASKNEEYIQWILEQFAFDKELNNVVSFWEFIYIQKLLEAHGRSDLALQFVDSNWPRLNAHDINSTSNRNVFGHKPVMFTEEREVVYDLEESYPKN